MDLSCNPFFRLRVLANEVEILQGSATLKTKQLKKAELNHAQHWKVSIFRKNCFFGNNKNGNSLSNFLILMNCEKNETVKVPSAIH